MKKFSKRIRGMTTFLAVAAGLALAASGEARAATGITGGDLLELRYATGHTGSTTKLWLDEINPTTKTLVQTINTGLTFVTGYQSNDSSYVGGLNLSSDGRYLTFTGYDAAAGLSLMNPTDKTTFSNSNTVIGRLNLATGTVEQVVKMSVGLGEFGAAVMRDANSYYVTNDLATASTDKFTVNSVTAGQVAAGGLTKIWSNTINVIRGLSIVDNQLYADAKLSSASGVFQIGSGLPTALANGSQYLYSTKSSSGVTGFMKVVASDGTTYVYAADGGLGKFSLQTGKYQILKYGTTDYRPDTGTYSYLAGAVDGDIATIFYSKGGGGLGDSILQWDDTIANTSDPSAATTIWNAPKETFINGDYGSKIIGLAYVPTPIPPAFYLLGSGLAGLGYFRRRWKA